MTVQTITKEELLQSWENLFNEFPWLEGWQSQGECSVFCCPGNPPDWQALSAARMYLFLSGYEGTLTTLTKDALVVKE